VILVCRELKTSIDQTFDLLLDRRYQIQEVSVNILMYDAPVGDFTFEILKLIRLTITLTFTFRCRQT